MIVGFGDLCIYEGEWLDRGWLVGAAGDARTKIGMALQWVGGRIGCCPLPAVGMGRDAPMSAGEGMMTTDGATMAGAGEAAAPSGGFRQMPVPEDPLWSEGKPDAADRSVVVLLVDPREVTRESIAHWLETHAREFRIHRFASAAELGRFEGDADLVILNIGAARVTGPAVRHALDLLGRAAPGVPLSLLAERDDTDDVIEALRLGVRGYLATSLSVGLMVEALRLIHAGGTFVPPSAIVNAVQERSTADAEPLPREALITGFTPRQIQVLDLLRQGKPNKIIAHELDMRQSTVKVHVRHVMTKLSASNRTQAALLANRLFGGDAEIGDRRSYDI